MIEDLRASNATLVARLGEAEQALAALARGEVDSVALASSVTPLLLAEAQAEARRGSAELLRMSQQLRVLAEAARAFASATDDYAQLLDTVARTLSEATRSTCVVCLLSPDGEVLDGVASHGADVEALRRVRLATTKFRFADHPEIVETLRSGTPFVDPPLDGTLLAPTRATALHGLAGNRCRLWVPLRLRGEPLGLLALVRAPDAELFTEGDRDLAQTLGDHAALAIGNARSYASERAARATAEAAEGRFRRLSESGLIGILIGDPAGGVAEINDAVLQMLDYSRDEIVSGAVVWRDLTPPEWRAGDAIAIDQLASARIADLREKEYFRRDGRRVPVLVGSAMLDGEAATSISFVLDLTERKAAQAAIARLHEARAADGRFRGLLESAPDAMVVVGAGGTVVFVNDRFETLFGYPRDAIVGSPIEAIVSDDLGGVCAKTRAAYSSTGRARPTERLELYARRKDGTRFPIEVSLSPVDAAGERLVSSAIRDITARRRADEQRLRLAAIVDSSDDAIIGKTLDGVITSWNRGAELTFGYTAEEIVGVSISSLVTDDGVAEEARILELAAQGTVQRVETARRTKSGRIIDVALTISPIRDAQGRVVGISDVARDVTARRRDELALITARDAAVAASRELETFSYSVAHDLRSPLRGINGFAELLVADYGAQLGAEAAGWLATILASTLRMGRLIEALLSLSRVARNDLAREAVDLSTLVRAAGERLAAADPGRAVELVVEPGQWVDIDPRLASVLVDNLLANAWKFTGDTPSPRIEFGVAEWNHARAFFVRDNGAGFDMAFASKLFVPFQRLHSVDEFPGTGIGLATVQRIVRRHGGEIYAWGNVGEGATFYFTLPPRTKGPG